MPKMPLRATPRLPLLLGAMSAAATLPVAAAEIDVLVLYTQGVEDRYAGDPQTRFRHLLEVSNQVYRDSNVDLSLRLAGAQKIAYPDGGSANTALDDLTYGRGAFASAEALRAQYSADMVLLYRVYDRSHGSCGLAWVNSGTKGQYTGEGAKRYMYSHVGIDACPDHTTVHELGHNMGLHHSRKQDGAGGAFPYALGYGVQGKFTDVMAYTSSFGVDYWTGTVYKFSNPQILCRNLPCGVERTRADGADAAYALQQTGPQVANFLGGQTAQVSTEHELLAQRLAQAEQTLQEARATRDAIKPALDSANLAVTTARAALDKLNKSAGKSITAYKQQQARLLQEQASLSRLATALQAAQRRVQTATTTAAQKSASTALTSALKTYDKQAQRVQGLQQALAESAPQIQVLQQSLTQATQALTAATATAKAEKARHDAAIKAVTSAEAAYKSLKTQFDRARLSR